MRGFLRVAGVAVVAGGLWLTGCSAEAPEPTTSVEAPATQEGLTLAERGDEVLSGTMTHEGQSVTFTSRKVREQVFEVEVVRGELTLTADIDFSKKQVLFDGFKTLDGQDTKMTEADKGFIEALGTALSGEKVSKTYEGSQRGEQIHTAGSAMMRAMGMWKVNPLDRSLRKDIKAETGRTILYLCGWLTGYGVQSTHDCWDCWDDWDGWSYINPGPNGYGENCYPGSCSANCANYNPYRCGRLDCEDQGSESYQGPNGTWQWGSDADKYGACTVWDTNIYPIDCLDHDHCVRNDHSLASVYCDDMLDNATDDQTLGNNCKMINGCGGNCGGSFTSGGVTCYCDAACDSYGDCCSDYHLMCDAGEGYKSYLGRSVARTWNYASRGGSFGK